MRIRLLNSNQYHLLPDLDQSPKPEFASILVAEDGDEIVAYWVIQDQVHVEPVWLKPEQRPNGRLMLKMWEQVQKLAGPRNPLYVSTNNSKVEKFLKFLGFKELGKAFVKEP